MTCIYLATCKTDLDNRFSQVKKIWRITNTSWAKRSGLPILAIRWGKALFNDPRTERLRNYRPVCDFSRLIIRLKSCIGFVKKERELAYNVSLGKKDRMV
jgi:hypothetical protein